jgi:hypothetical protein
VQTGRRERSENLWRKNRRAGWPAKIVEKEMDQDYFLRSMRDSDIYASSKPEIK